MFCPKCGFDMGDNNTCEKCGFVVANEEEKTDVLEDVSVDIDETENVETEVEDEIGATEEDLVVDFNQIDENAAKSTKKRHTESGPPDRPMTTPSPLLIILYFSIYSLIFFFSKNNPIVMCKSKLL